MAGMTAGTDPLVADLLHACSGIRPSGMIWIAFSGGLDSSVLLHAASMARTAGLQAPLTAVHVDHGLHPDSGHWNSHCRAACSALDIEYRTLTVTVEPETGERLEACARNARYEALRPLLGEGDILLAAHHRDDQAETSTTLRFETGPRFRL